MSKAFTKEDDAVDEPLVRPVLDLGPRYITATGAERLRERVRGGDEAARRVLDVVIVVEPRRSDVVVFGSCVTVRGEDDTQRRLCIAGVDEVGGDNVSWLSPLGRALMGASVGDVVTVETPKGEDELEVLAIG